MAGKGGTAYLLAAKDLGGVGRPLTRRRVAGAVFGASAYAAAQGKALVIVPGRGARAAPCTGSGGLTALAVTGHALRTAWCSVSMIAAGPPIVTAPRGQEGVVWDIDSGSGRLYALSLKSGKTLTSVPLGSAVHFEVPTISGGDVLAVDGNALEDWRLGSP